jgi:CcmD family protein
MRKILLSALLMLGYISMFAQAPNQVEMADALRSSGKIYVVIAIIVVIFLGLAVYLFSIDRRLRKIEKEK